jgi:hypothetical protein
MSYYHDNHWEEFHDTVEECSLTQFNMPDLSSMGPRSLTENVHYVDTSQIVFDPRLQVRVSGLNPDTVDEYCDAMREGDEFPPVEIYRVEETLYVVDGWHRVQAARVLHLGSIKSVIFEGTWDEAVEHARFNANRKNGQRLTRADKQALCETLLNEPKYKEMSDRELAKLSGVSHPAIAATRKRLGMKKPEFSVGADGKVRSTGKVSSSLPNVNTDPPFPSLEGLTAANLDESLRQKINERLSEHLQAINATIETLERNDLVSVKVADCPMDETIRSLIHRLETLL